MFRFDSVDDQLAGLRVFLTAVTLAALVLLGETNAWGQAGLRESLELLDRDQNGYLDPEEVTPLARPYLERIAKARRLSLKRPNRIDQLQEAARIYYALQNGVAGEDVRPEREATLKRFGPGLDDLVVPQFGEGPVKHPYEMRDVYEARSTIRRLDRDEDGKLDRREAYRGKWTHRDPFSMDLNKDDLLSEQELAQRYARRRQLNSDAGELVKRAVRVGNGIERSDDPGKREREERERRDWWRTGGNRFWLTSALISRYDSNKNGRLEENETIDMKLPVGMIDVDRNGELTRDELFAYVQKQQDQTGGQVEGLPSWFYESDANQDKQIELTEYAKEINEETVNQFLAMDANGDGFLTTMEVLSSKSMMGGVFASEDAELLPPKKTIVSEIEISEDFVIQDLNVQLNITHTSTGMLDAFLTGPDETRIELFTAVGGGDDHFQKTTFDDQSRYNIVKARPPFEGNFQPEGLIKRQPGLSAFNGKSIKGTWQLSIVGTRSERFGMLHHWSIIATPDKVNLPATGEPNAEDEQASPAISTSAVSFTSEKPQWSGENQSAYKNPSSSRSMAEYWTPERKAEYADKLRKPDAAKWDSMSDRERQAFNERRNQAIAKMKEEMRQFKGKETKSGKEKDPENPKVISQKRS